MSAKKRKNHSPWSSCDYCSVVIAQKDALLHKEKSCPPNSQTWIHSFIVEEKLYSTVDTFQVQDKSIELIPKENKNDFVLMPCHVLQLCKIPVGDPVIIQPYGNSHGIPFVKLAWFTQEKISDLSVALTPEGQELNCLQPKHQVVISKIQQKISPAKIITVSCENEGISLDELENLVCRVQKQNINKTYCVGNRILLKHYGNQFIFKVVNIVPVMEEEINEHGFTFVTSETNWKLDKTVIKNEKPKNLLNKLGGIDSIISDLKDFISYGLKKSNVLSGLQITRGILIYGPPGTGKTALIEALAEHFTNNVIRVECSQIFSKFTGETEKELYNYFEKAKQMSPSIILIDDLDVLCAKSNSSSEFEKRITATLSLLMEKLNNESDKPVVVLGTTSKIYQIEKTLRSPSRFGKEVELYVPSSPQRYEIMKILLTEVDHDLTESDIKNIADSSHGFVGADLVSLVSKAALRNFKRSEGKEKVSFNDFEWAVSKIKPSAMREIMIEVPNVRWSDIGGQDDLKLKLRQCIEWPLKYKEAFEKLGITPPKGVLMFGPPGCSKTMIAKALATESKLNFISVKGPELFSKWVGESEKAVRKVFRRARQAAPSIIFFDELDAIGGERNIASGANVQERVLAQLLTELDGVESLDNVTVIAATNRLDRIDPALIRPGRLDRIIYVPLPDYETRRDIFTLQLQKSCVSDDVIIEELIEKTDGYSGAEIIAVCREAALKALEENIKAEVVMRKHFLDALNIVIPRTPKSLLDIYNKYLLK